MLLKLRSASFPLLVLHSIYSLNQTVNGNSTRCVVLLLYGANKQHPSAPGADSVLTIMEYSGLIDGACLHIGTVTMEMRIYRDFVNLDRTK